MIGSETGSRVPSPTNKFEFVISSLKVRNSLRLQISMKFDINSTNQWNWMKFVPEVEQSVVIPLIQFRPSWHGRWTVKQVGRLK